MWLENLRNPKIIFVHFAFFLSRFISLYTLNRIDTSSVHMHNWLYRLNIIICGNHFGVWFFFGILTLYNEMKSEDTKHKLLCFPFFVRCLVKEISFHFINSTFFPSLFTLRSISNAPKKNISNEWCGLRYCFTPCMCYTFHNGHQSCWFASKLTKSVQVCAEEEEAAIQYCVSKRARNETHDKMDWKVNRENRTTHTHCAVCRTEPTKPEGKYTQTAELGSVERSFFYILETNRFHMQMFFFVRNASVVLRFSFLRRSFFYLHSLEVICGFCCVPDFIFGTDSISAMHFFS